MAARDAGTHFRLSKAQLSSWLALAWFAKTAIAASGTAEFAPLIRPACATETLAGSLASAHAMKTLAFSIPSIARRLSPRGCRHRSHGTAALVRREGLRALTPSPPNIPWDPCLFAPAQGGPLRPSALGLRPHPPLRSPRRPASTRDPPFVASAQNHLNPWHNPRQKHYFFPVLNWGGMMRT